MSVVRKSESDSKRAPVSTDVSTTSTGSVASHAAASATQRSMATGAGGGVASHAAASATQRSMVAGGGSGESFSIPLLPGVSSGWWSKGRRDKINNLIKDYNKPISLQNKRSLAVQIRLACFNWTTGLGNDKKEMEKNNDIVLNP